MVDAKEELSEYTGMDDLVLFGAGGGEKNLPVIPPLDYRRIENKGSLS